MTTYIKQHWVITLDDLKQFARDKGWNDEDVDEIENTWDLFGDGRDCHAEFERSDLDKLEDTTLAAILTVLFDENSSIENILTIR